MLRGIVLFVILFVGTVPIFLLLLLFGLPPLLFPESVRVTLRGPQLLCGRAWITMCLAGFRLFGVSAPEVEGEVRLNAQGRYLLLSNHASWTDIVVLLQLFGPRMPFPRFLAKREMLWVPLIGIAIWLLDFPLLRRSTRVSSPERAARDRTAVARTCRRLGSSPFTLVIFPEGTRFTRAKQRTQQSPFESLLRPRAGGAWVAMKYSGEHLDGVIDVTIAYSPQDLTYIDYLSGKGRARVHVDLISPPEMLQASEG